MVNAPLVMPEVVIGLSLLLLMVGAQNFLGWPERGLRDHRAGPHLAGHGLRHGGGAVALCSRWTDRSKRPPWTWVQAPAPGVFSGDLAQHRAGILAAFLLASRFRSTMW
jgi:putrescine transport system permease protein